MAQKSLILCVTIAASVKFTVGNITAQFVGYLPDIEVQGAAVYDGKDSVFFMGGLKTIQAPPYYVGRDELLQYNIHNGSFQNGGKFKNAVFEGVTGTDGNGTCYQFGGAHYEPSGIYGGYSPVPRPSIFSFSAEKPSPVQLLDLPVPLRKHSVASDGNGSIYILGGHTSETGYGSPSLAIYKYNTATQKTEIKGSLTKGLQSPSTVYINGAVYIFGGTGYYPETTVSNEILKFAPGNGPNGKIEVIGVKLEGYLTGYASVVAVGTDVYIFSRIYNGINQDFQLLKFDTLVKTVVKVPVTFPRIFAMYKSPIYEPKPIYIPAFNRIYIFGGSFLCAPASEFIFYFQL